MPVRASNSRCCISACGCSPGRFAWELVKTLAPMATPLAWIADRLRSFGTDKGGLRIDLYGAKVHEPGR